MHKAGKLAVFAGIALIVLGMVVGFITLFADKDDSAAIWLGIIPLGFILLLAGTVITQLSGTEQSQYKGDEFD